MSVLEIRNLSKSYGGNPALRDVSLDVSEGVTGLLGPNGAGKSTLLMCVLGLLPDFTGQVTVLGLDARRDRREIRRRVGFMPETDAYLPDMTGIQAVRYLGQLTGMGYAEALRRAHEVLFHCGLGEAVYRNIAEYSTGMRQRFKLAQAIVHDPELIFLDEPLSGMDPAGRDELLHLIHDLSREHGKHVLWSSHILPDVQKVADGVVVLDKGVSRGSYRLEDLHPREGVFAVEVEGGSEAFLHSLTERGIPFRAEDHDGLRAGAGRSAWVLDMPEGQGVPSIMWLARENGVRVRRVGPLRENLEDIFHRILDAGEKH